MEQKRALYSGHPHQVFIDDAIKQYGEAGSYRGAEALFETMIRPFVSIFRPEHIRTVVDSAKANGQIYCASETRLQLAYLFEQTLELTRRDIRRALLREGICWSGDLEETEFLSRLYNLSSLPSYDHRFSDAAADIWQHRVNNHDWEDFWVFEDDRRQLADGPDEVFLNFLAEMVHPAVRADREQAKSIVALLNDLLAPD